MQSSERENQRYKEADHCKIMAEEKMMFKILENWSRKFSDKSAINILDIGCGSGLITKEIINLGYKARGLDFSEEAIKKAIRNGVDARLCNLDEKIDGANQEFDIIWAGDIIEHVFDPIGLLREANRVLKNGGIIILSVPNDVSLFNRIKMLFGVSYQEQMYKKSGFYKHHTFFNLRLIKYMLDANNLKIIEIHKFLDLGNNSIKMLFSPSLLYNEMVICAQKRP